MLLPPCALIETAGVMGNVPAEFRDQGAPSGIYKEGSCLKINARGRTSYLKKNISQSPERSPL
jgi:hypothetical protein